MQRTTIWKTFTRLWPTIFPYKSGIIISILALVLNSIGDTAILSLLKPILDDGFSKSDRNVLMWISIMIIFLMFVRGISNYISNYCLFWVSGNIVMNIRCKLFYHIMNMPTSFFDTQPTGNLISRIIYDSEQIATSSSRTLVTIVREGTAIIGLFTLMFYHSWQLSIIVLFLVPIVSTVIYFLSAHFRQISKIMQNIMGTIASKTEQMLKGHKEVLIFGGQKIEVENFKKISNSLRKQTMKLASATSMSDPIIQFIISLTLAFILYIASFPYLIKTLTAGSVTVILSSMIAIMKPLKSLINVNTKFQKGIAACQALFSILDIKKEKDNGTITAKKIKGKVEFKNVTFSYPGCKLPVLNSINLTILPGEIVAIVGKSGSGKSTIINLLTRFYTVNSGEILIDDYNLNDYTLSSIRKQISLVPQDIHLFNDTIANNITYASRKLYSRKQIKYATKITHSDEFISKMSYGLDTVIGENGSLLSVGQRQKIAIARAVLRDRKILIFDEATSSLDIESEKIIQILIKKFQKRKTCLVITHKLSTIKKADLILVVDNGYIVGQGKHVDLMEKCEIYHNLYCKYTN